MAKQNIEINFSDDATMDEIKAMALAIQEKIFEITADMANITSIGFSIVSK